MECLRCGGDHLSADCPYFSTPNKAESTTYCKQCDRDPCECEKRKLMRQQKENERKRRLEMDNNDGPALKRRRMNNSERKALESKLQKLSKMMAKSKISISSESNDKLSPFILYNDDKIIEIPEKILGAIKASNCLLSGVDVVCDLITEFLVADGASFSTKQFLTLLTSGSNMKHKGLKSFTNNLRYMEMGNSRPNDVYLKEDVMAQIDGQRKALTHGNARDMHGISGGKKKAAFAWVDWMNKELGGCSIYKVPCNVAVEHGGNDMWEYTFVHSIVGRTEDGHIIGLCAEVIWT